MGRNEALGGSEHLFASESVAVEALGFRFLRDVEPGEAVFVDLQGRLHAKQCAAAPRLVPCIFEYVYLARPDSVIDGASVYHSPLNMGAELAAKIGAMHDARDVDVVPLACLGGCILLLYEYIGHGSMKIQEIKSILETKLAIKPFKPRPSAEGTIESILIKDRTPPPDESKLTQPESPSVHRVLVFPPPGKEKQQLMEVKVVERGEFLVSLAKKYYRMTNTTLIALILDCNPEITNADLILLNQKIKLPKITEELLITQYNEHTYKIHVGTFQNPNFVRFVPRTPHARRSRPPAESRNSHSYFVNPFAAVPATMSHSAVL